MQMLINLHILMNIKNYFLAVNKPIEAQDSGESEEESDDDEEETLKTTNNQV